MSLSAHSAKRNSQPTATQKGNTAAMSAILPTGLGVARMTEEQFRAEKLYQTTMNIARRMLSQGLISEEEYCQIDTIFLEKYRPVFGTLCSAMPLTSRA